MTNQPAVPVSVIIPAYNQGRFIAEAIESVLAQDYPQERIEIIVVDDGSTDGTREVVARFKNRVSYINNGHQGKALTTKAGIDAARGAYIFNLDSDDKFLPDKIRKVVEVFERDKDIIHVGHPAIYWNTDIDTRRVETVPDKVKERKVGGGELLLYFLRTNSFIGGGSTFAARAGILKRIPITKKEIGYAIDLYMVMQCAQQGASYYFGEPLSLYRVHASAYSLKKIQDRARIDAAASEAILSEIDAGDFDEEVKRLFALRARVAKLKAKEVAGNKNLSDIAGLWSFILKSRKYFGKNVINTIVRYGVLQRSVPFRITKSKEVLSKDSTYLLLTACVDPKSDNIFSPSERAAHYIETLRFYLTADIQINGIVFVENSGYPIDSFRNVPNPYNKKLEFISCNCSYPILSGPSERKGYGEMFAISEAMTRSVLLKEAAYIAKLTGRIRVLNLDRLLHSVRRDFDLLCDVKDVGWILRRLQGIPWAAPYADTRFFIFTIEFYQRYLASLLQKIVDKNLVFERSVYELITHPVLKGKVIMRFPIEPYYSGLAGSRVGISYDTMYSGPVRAMRNIMRIVAPWLHI